MLSDTLCGFRRSTFLLYKAVPGRWKASSVTLSQCSVVLPRSNRTESLSEVSVLGSKLLYFFCHRSFYGALRRSAELPAACVAEDVLIALCMLTESAGVHFTR